MRQTRDERCPHGGDGEELANQADGRGVTARGSPSRLRALSDPGPPAGQTAFRYDPARRGGMATTSKNIDGTHPEHIVQYIAAPDRMEAQARRPNLATSSPRG
jgi:hypothetical protein